MGVDGERATGVGAYAVVDLVGEAGDDPANVVVVEDAAGTNGVHFVDHTRRVNETSPEEKRVPPTPHGPPTAEPSNGDARRCARADDSARDCR
jgi:hypothetical protein